MPLWPFDKNPSACLGLRWWSTVPIFCRVVRIANKGLNQVKEKCHDSVLRNAWRDCRQPSSAQFPLHEQPLWNKGAKRPATCDPL